MLKLTLKQGDTINIGNEISIKLASDTVYRASILIDAPEELGIMRKQEEQEGEPRDVRAPKKVIVVDRRKA